MDKIHGISQVLSNIREQGEIEEEEEEEDVELTEEEEDRVQEAMEPTKVKDQMREKISL